MRDRRIAAKAGVATVFACALAMTNGCGPVPALDGSTYGEGSTATPGGEKGGASSGFGGGSSSGGGAGCASGAKTALTGHVFDPSGTIPLYNAVVYLPSEDLEPFAPGVTCDKCGTTPSGKPYATALTNAKGEFRLENAPASAPFDLVVQVGRWRRKVRVPAVTACKDNALDAELTRLPRNRTEGELPQIAVTTGEADSLECFLRKLGIDDAEFTNPGGPGAVHLYQGRRKDGKEDKDGARIDGGTPAAPALWNDLGQLKKYDMVLLSCEGAENLETKSTGARSNVRDYLNAGGRVFASHFHYVWFKQGPSPLPSTASWTENDSESDGAVTVDQSVAKGKSFAEWLVEVNASTTLGLVPMSALKRNVGGVSGGSRRWLYSAGERTKFFSFNAPIGAPPDLQCGRGVYTDIHLSSGDTSEGTFPSGCTTKGLTPQEKALLFLLFDLSSCIQDDAKAPEPPPPVVK